MALSSATKRHPGSPLEWRRRLFLGGGTLLFILGLFCAWQAWLVAGEAGAIESVHAAQDKTVQALASEIAKQRNAVQQGLKSFDPATIAGDPAAAAAALRQRLPQVKNLELYSGDLTEVLHANYNQFGYAKAAQLLDAQGAGDVPLMQSIGIGAGNRRLTIALPLGPANKPGAWVWIELPFAPLQQLFESMPPGSGRLELRQNNDHGELSLSSLGSASAMAEASGKPVPGSVFNITAALPDAPIVMPHVWPLDALLSVIGLAGAFFLLRLRERGLRPSLPDSDDVALPAKLPTGVLASASTMPRTTKPSALVPPVATAPALAIEPSIFRAYDVRGVVGTTLNKGVARALGQAIGMLMGEKGLREIVVGRDGRLSGPELAGALADGLRATGIDVIDIGAVPTPVVYFAAFRFNTGCGVAVTGSHNPPDYNGFKIVVGGETLAEDAIQDLYQRIVTGALREDGQGQLREVDVSADYIERIVGDVQTERPLKIVVDCGNGIPGILAPQVLEGVGCDVFPLYCDVDGTFPNHHPDPSDPDNLEDLIAAVKSIGADLGIAFDGDGDRLGVVTRTGEIIFPDRLLMLFARDVLSRQPGATVIYDVKCTGYLKSQILDAGGSPLMWRTGHSLIKAKMRETGAELAGEMSGHFFFKERWYGFDDGIYAAARLMEILSGDLHGRSPEEIFATLPKSVSTPELKIELTEGEHYRFMETFRKQAVFPDATLITIDGVRADWPDGWGLVRASNTTPVLVLRFEADNAAALKRVQAIFREQLLAVDFTLKIPF
jgi:phosphomannomutase/phosphoglucomutase